MSQALYRTYRPSSFDELVGQEPIIHTLQNELKHNRVAHAYLFSGPRGVGKTTTARLLAQAVNTQSLHGDERQRVAEEIISGKSIDVIEIDAASHTGVDNVRENIIENARFTPQRLPYKVFIIDEVHMLSPSAFNALLKTLEEPPGHVIFILATTEIHRVPETIISRCQRFDFKRVPVPKLLERLEYIVSAEKMKVDIDVLRTIARRADGSVRDAEVLLGQILTLDDKEITAEQAALVLPQSNTQSVVALVASIINRQTGEGITLINQLMQDGVQLQDFAREVIEFLRVALLYRAHGLQDELEAYGFDDDMRNSFEAMMQQISPAQLVTMIETFVAAEKELRFAQIPQLPLELAIVSLTTDDESDGVMPPATPSTPAPAAQQPSTASASSGTLEPAATPKPEKPVTPAKPATKKSKTKATASLEQIRKQWPNILDAISEQQRSVGMSLKVAAPYSIEDGRLIIAFQHAFHAERIGQPTVRATIQDILNDQFGLQLGVGTTVIEPSAFDEIRPAEPTPPVHATVQRAVDVFGGEIIAEEN